jgi:hypothetical protein
MNGMYWPDIAAQYLANTSHSFVRSLQDASHRSIYDALTFTSSTKKEDVTQLEEVVAPKRSLTV